MSIINDEFSNIFITEPNPNIIGPNLTGINIRDGTFVNLTATNISVSGTVTMGGVSISSVTLVAPAISLSEIQIVSTLATNMPLALLPKGTGGILVDIPDNAATGGAARGDYSVDLQFLRTVSTQVASGTGSFLVATQNCTAAANYSSIVSGLSNTINAACTYGSLIGCQTSTIANSVQTVGISSSGITLNGGNNCALIATTGAISTTATYSLAAASNIPTLLNATSCSAISVNNSTAGGGYSIIAASTGGYVLNGNYNFIAGCTNCNTEGTSDVLIASSNSSMSGSNNNTILSSDNCQINIPSTYCSVIASNNGSTASQNYSMAICSDSAATNAPHSLLACGANSSITASQYFCGIGSNIVAAARSNSFIFSDASAGTIAPPNANSFTVRATGATAMAVYTDAGATTGVTIAAGASAWAVVSDRNVKENIALLDLSWASSAVAELPVYTYNFIGRPAEQRCIGPMAQDWAQTWQTNKSPRHIDTGDLAGITLGALKDALRRLAALEAAVAKAGIQV